MHTSTVAVEHSSAKQSQVYKIEWNLGKRCNFNCSYCDEYTHDNHSPHIPFEVAKKAIDKILEKVGDRKIKINLTGGEPTVNKDFEKILDYMYERGIDVGMTTNGSRTYDFYQRNFHKFATMIFSYHMEYHKREVIPENVVKLAEYNKTLAKPIHMHVHVMMLPTQFEEAKDVIQYFKDNDVPVVMRRIRAAYMKDHPDNEYFPDGRLMRGTIAPPFYDGVVTLAFNKVGGPNYESLNYYSPEELKFLETNNVGE